MSWSSITNCDFPCCAILYAVTSVKGPLRSQRNAPSYACWRQPRYLNDFHLVSLTVFARPGFRFTEMQVFSFFPFWRCLSGIHLSESRLPSSWWSVEAHGKVLQPSRKVYITNRGTNMVFAPNIRYRPTAHLIYQNASEPLRFFCAAGLLC